MIRYGGPSHRAPKHRAAGPAVEHGWTRWPRHRSEAEGPMPADGMEEYAAKWVAAMKLRERELHRARQAALS